MQITFLIGRIIVGLYYLSSGIRHFTHLDMMAGYAGSKGVRVAKLGVVGSGALLVRHRDHSFSSSDHVHDAQLLERVRSDAEDE
jgi:hypothetical protein